YSLQEESSTLVTFDYDAATGRLTANQTISSLPKGFAGTNYTSEVMVSADGRFVYAANRLHDSITWFAIGPNGTLTFKGEAATRGPRSNPLRRFQRIRREQIKTLLSCSSLLRRFERIRREQIKRCRLAAACFSASKEYAASKSKRCRLAAACFSASKEYAASK